jgi:uncharacterized protein YggU (UPF0235/DUF167 family)
MSRYKRCPDCNQPMLPNGKVKLPGEYEHASGCPRVEKDDWVKQKAAEEDGANCAAGSLSLDGRARPEDGAGNESLLEEFGGEWAFPEQACSSEEIEQSKQRLAELKKKILARMVVARPEDIALAKCPECQSPLKLSAQGEYCSNDKCRYVDGIVMPRLKPEDGAGQSERPLIIHPDDCAKYDDGARVARPEGELERAARELDMCFSAKLLPTDDRDTLLTVNARTLLMRAMALRTALDRKKG